MTNTNLKLIETYYDEAKTKVKERYYIDENGLRQGMYESFYENGNNGIRCTYKDSELNGLYEEFDVNNKIRAKCDYKDSKRDGLYELFSANGKSINQFVYKKGKITEQKTILL